MLEDEKQDIVYKAIKDVNKTYKEQEITEKDPILYFKRIKNWCLLFYAFDVSEKELTSIIAKIQQKRKKEKEEVTENHEKKENS